MTTEIPRRRKRPTRRSTNSRILGRAALPRLPRCGADNLHRLPPIDRKIALDSAPKRCPQWCPGCPIWRRPICTPGGGICPNLHSWGTKKADASEMDVGRKALPRRGLELLILVQQGLTSPSVTIPLSTPNRTRTCNLRFRRRKKGRRKCLSRQGFSDSRNRGVPVLVPARLAGEFRR